MSKYLIGGFTALLIFSLFIRGLFTFTFPNSLPFHLNIIDWLIVIFADATILTALSSFIKKKYPDTAEFLPIFSGICFTIILAAYAVLVYAPTYQASLSVMVTGSLVGMGWWIQCITSAANTRRSHTLNTIINTRTSAEYQSQLRKCTAMYRGMRYIPQEFCEWRCNPDKEEYKNAKIPTEYKDAINGLLYVLNYFEFLAKGIQYKDLDDVLLRECFCTFLKGVERRGFHLILESQKLDPISFDGIIYLSKKWNGESFVEKHRSNPNTPELGVQYPSNDIVQNIIEGKPLVASVEFVPDEQAANNSPAS